MPSAEEITEKSGPQTSREENNKSAPKNQLTLNTLTSSTSKKESPAIIKTQSGIINSRTAHKDPYGSQNKLVPPLMQKGHSLQVVDDLKNQSPLKGGPYEALELKHKSPPQQKTKMGTIVSGRRGTLNYGHL